MRTAAITDPGGPAGITVRHIEDPEPGPEDALVRVEACALNRRDLSILQADGRLGEDALPYVPCSDVAGVVEAVGADIDRPSPGDRVVVSPNRTCGTCRACRADREHHCDEFSIADGGLAEFTAAPADRLVPLPDGVSFAAAAALPVAYVTAWRMIATAGVEPMELVFVPGATGGVGVAAVQLAELIGADAVGTSRSPEKLERLSEAGATHVIATDDPDEVKEALRDIGRPDVVIDHMGGTFTTVGLRAMARAGRHVICGSTVAPRAEIDLPNFYLGQKTLYGSTMGTQRDLERLVRFVEEGRLSPVVGAEYTLDEAADAFAALADRRAFGKLIVRPNA